MISYFYFCTSCSLTPQFLLQDVSSFLGRAGRHEHFRFVIGHDHGRDTLQTNLFQLGLIITEINFAAAHRTNGFDTARTLCAGATHMPLRLIDLGLRGNLDFVNYSLGYFVVHMLFAFSPSGVPCSIVRIAF